MASEDDFDGSSQHYVSRDAEEIQSLQSQVQSLEQERERLRGALNRVSMIPDKGGDRATLEAAVAIARQALQTTPTEAGPSE